MRRILVDSARRKRQLKRGGEHEPMELWETRLAAPVEDEKLLQVHEALDTLAREDALKSEIVKLRYFIGLNHHQIADVLEVNEKTVRRHWGLAKIRLYDIISADNEMERGVG
jgi:RNA polymerase sigma factor (sigma-70 family)